MPKATRWQDIISHLNAKGFTAYPPANFFGECKKPYIVVRDAGSSKLLDYSSTFNLYEVLCYVPQNQFSQLEVFVNSVKAAMNELKPMIMPTYFDTPSFYDDGSKSHMISIQYRNARQII